MKTLTYYSDPLEISREQVLDEQRFPAELVDSPEALQERFARDFAELVHHNNQQEKKTVLMVQPGVLDLRRVAERLNSGHIGCARLVMFVLTEFCGEQGRLLAPEHPLSLQGSVRRDMFDRIDPERRPDAANLVFPDPRHAGAFGARISEEGGVEACFATLGMNGHFLANLPGEAGSEDAEAYLELPTRVVRLTPDARLEQALLFAGGDVASTPRFAVTAGLRDVMQAARIRLYLSERWQSAVLRRSLYGPVTARYPASLLQQHPDLQMILVEEVAEPPRLGPHRT
jgi:glucosamine-6-phosphate deaminase